MSLPILLVSFLLTSDSVKSWSYFCELSCGSKNVGCRREPCGPGPHCGKKFKMFPLEQADREYILEQHNQLRSDLALGLAANITDGDTISLMYAMSYDMELEFLAQCHANACLRSYQKGFCSSSSNFKYVGKATAFEPEIYSYLDTKQIVMQAFSSWMDGLVELDMRVDDNDRYMKEGDARYNLNTIQVIWAKTTHLGCARTFGGILGNIFVCYYGPRGLTRHEPIFSLGPLCSGCHKECNKTTGLCGKIEFTNTDWVPPFEIAGCKKLYGEFYFLLPLLGIVFLYR